MTSGETGLSCAFIVYKTFSLYMDVPCTFAVHHSVCSTLILALGVNNVALQTKYMLCMAIMCEMTYFVRMLSTRYNMLALQIKSEFVASCWRPLKVVKHIQPQAGNRASFNASHHRATHACSFLMFLGCSCYSNACQHQQRCSLYNCQGCPRD